jgi:hypothetical protein
MNTCTTCQHVRKNGFHDARNKVSFLGYLTPGIALGGTAMLPAGASLIERLEGKCSLAFDLLSSDRVYEHTYNFFFSVVTLYLSHTMHN